MTPQRRFLAEKRPPSFSIDWHAPISRVQEVTVTVASLRFPTFCFVFRLQGQRRRVALFDHGSVD